MDRLDCNRMFVAVMETGSFIAAEDAVRSPLYPYGPPSNPEFNNVFTFI